MEDKSFSQTKEPTQVQLYMTMIRSVEFGQVQSLVMLASTMVQPIIFIINKVMAIPVIYEY